MVPRKDPARTMKVDPGDLSILRPGERIDELIHPGLRIIQHEDMLKFSLDAILLARFVTLRGEERVADLGTGGGVIPLVLAGLRTVGSVSGFEIQPAVADMAGRSVQMNGFGSKIEIHCGDLRQMPREYWGGFDVVVSNPPYLTANEGKINPKPAVAIAKYELECALEDVLRAAAKLLRPEGRAAFVYRPKRLTELLAGLREAHFSPKRLRMVHPRDGSDAGLVLVEAVLRGRPGLTVLPPLIVHTADGGYTDEVKAIYGRPYPE